MGILIEKINNSTTEANLNNKGIIISNISATFSLNGKYDREKLASDLDNSEYNPKKHRSLIYDSQRVDSLVVLLPPSGRVSISGAKNKQEIITGISEFVDDLTKLGIDTSYSQIEVENILANCSLNRKVNLVETTLSLGLELCEYEPEQFSGLIYRQKSAGVVLIFNSGKVVITKAKTYNDVLNSYIHIKDKVV
jgi:transcription initiation factor TFIID TATA-box-binding protein